MFKKNVSNNEPKESSSPLSKPTHPQPTHPQQIHPQQIHPQPTHPQQTHPQQTHPQPTYSQQSFHPNFPLVFPSVSSSTMDSQTEATQPKTPPPNPFYPIYPNVIYTFPVADAGKRKDEQTPPTQQNDPITQISSLPPPLIPQKIKREFAFHKVETSKEAPSSPSLQVEKKKVSIKKESQELYGNKFANLEVLQSLFKDIKGVDVPPFIGISEKETAAHLEKYYPDYKKDWIGFQNSLNGNSGRIGAEQEKILSDIQIKILKAFKDQPFYSEAMQTFLNELPPNSTLMVRSTGKEDSEELANAGGNESKAGVTPEQLAISVALGQVIASYHSPLSLTQRAIAGQDITQPVTTPVLVQKMIGEPAGGASSFKDIPISGLAYTREALGKTENVTQLQCAFGHNEAVVNSRIPVDTYYAYPDGSHHQIIRPKKTRLVANKEGGFNSLSNPSQLQKTATLSSEQVSFLQKVSESIHENYGKSMDIEWVFDPQTQQLWLVQARPLVSTVKQDPSIVDKKKAGAKETFSGEAIVSNGGKVTPLFSKKSVIVDRTLQAAFGRYLKLANEGAEKEIKAIIIKRPDVATSHYACTLREKGVAVFFCPEFSEEQIIDKKQFALIDSQQGKLFVLENPAISSEKDLEDSGLIKKGWFKHPIAAIESLQALDFNGEELNNFYKTLFSQKEPPFREVKHFKKAFKNLRSSDEKKAQEGARALTQWLIRNLSKLEEGQEKERGKLIFQNFLPIAYQIATQKDHLQRLHGANRLEALLMQESVEQVVDSDSFSQLFLEKKRMQQATEKKLPNLSESELAILRFIEKQEEKKLSKEPLLSPESLSSLKLPMSDEELHYALATYKVVEKLALNEETKQAWSNFSRSIAASRSRYANQVLMALIMNYQNSGIFEEWLHSGFIDHLVSKEEPISSLINLRSEFLTIFPQLKEISQAKAQLEHCKMSIDLWADPKQFTPLFVEFKKTLNLAYSLSEHFDKKSTSPLLVRSAVMVWLQEMTDIYDQSFKTLSHSPLYPNKKLCCINFLNVLRPFSFFLEDWIERIPKEKEEDWSRVLKSGATGNRVTPSEGLKDLFIQKSSKELMRLEIKVEKLCEESQFANLLEPSSEFNVSASTIDSGNLKSIKRENITLEDYFTLIHQNLLASFQASHQQPLLEKLPSNLKDFHKKLQKTERVFNFGLDKIHLKVNLLGMQYNYPYVTLKYNLPMKNHSSSIVVHYDTRTQETIVETHIFGHNMGDRMTQIGRDVVLQSIAYEQNLKDLPNFDPNLQIFSFSWNFRKEDYEKDPSPLSFVSQVLLEAGEKTTKGSLGTFVGSGPVMVKNLIVTENLAYERLLSLKNQELWEKFDFPQLGELKAFIINEINSPQSKKVLLKKFIKLAGLEAPEELDGTFYKKLSQSFADKFEENPLKFAEGEVKFIYSRIIGNKNLFQLKNKRIKLLLDTLPDDFFFHLASEKNLKKFILKKQTTPEERFFIEEIHKKITSSLIEKRDKNAISEYIDFLHKQNMSDVLGRLKIFTEYDPKLKEFADKIKVDNFLGKNTAKKEFEALDSKMKVITNISELEALPSDSYVLIKTPEAQDGSWTSAKIYDITTNEKGEKILRFIENIGFGGVSLFWSEELLKEGFSIAVLFGD